MLFKEVLEYIGRTLEENYYELFDPSEQHKFYTTYTINKQYYDQKQFNLSLELLEFITHVVDTIVSIEPKFLDVENANSSSKKLIKIRYPKAKGISEDYPLRIVYPYEPGNTLFTFLSEMKKFKKKVVDPHWQDLIEYRKVLFNLKDPNDRSAMIEQLKTWAKIYRRLKQYIKVQFKADNAPPTLFNVRSIVELGLTTHPVIWFNIEIPVKYSHLHPSTFKNPFSALLEVVAKEIRELEKKDKKMKKKVNPNLVSYILSTIM